MTDPKYPDPIQGIIPFGTLTLFAGAPGVGKTAMLMDWIARMATGRKIWGHATSLPTGFYYIAADRQWNSHARWLELAGIPEGLVKHYSVADDPQLDLTKLLDAHNAVDFFEQSLNKLAPLPGGLVFADPISPLFIAGNPNNSRDVARTFISMSRIAQSRQLSFIFTAHFGKQIGDSKQQYARPQDRIAGSGAFSGFSDTQVYLIDPMPPDQPYHILGWNPRHARPQEFMCQRAESGLFVPYDLIAEDETAQKVLDQLDAAGPTTFAVIVDRSFEHHQISKATVKRALERLLTQSRVAKVGRGRYARIKLH